jgi:bacterial/archaeal transporter family protein
MSGILYALIAMALWGFEELFLKESITKIRSLTTLLINTITGLLLQIVIIIVFIQEKVTVLYGNDLLLVIGTSIVAFLGYLFLYLALERQELSLISSLDESWIIISILIAVIFFGETLGAVHIFSIIIVLLGALLISANFSKLRNIKFISGSGYELLSLVFIGITVPLEKIVVGRVGEANAIFYLGVLILPLIFIARLFMKKKFVKPGRTLRIAIASGLFDGVAFVFYLLAIKETEISIVAPIIASSVVVSILLARIYLKERMTTKEIVGAILILIGVIILSVMFDI